MSTTISAKLVAEGVGFPRWLLFRCRACGDESDVGWLEVDGRITDPMCIRCGASVDGLDVCLDDPQTSFGVALDLDEWERASLKSGECVQRWAVRLAIDHGGPEYDRALSRFVARLTAIAHDHQVRRALGEDPKLGTLGRLEQNKPHDVWFFYIEGRPAPVFVAKPMRNKAVRVVPALSELTDPAKALAAIYEAVNRGV